jgi:EAL domain-containing protein (putative c-di-GMP-specific phosphodiesterase class I)
LLRWRHPDLGLIPPARFIPVAEESGLIGAVGEHVLRCAARQLREWRDSGLTLLPIAINVSPLQFERGTLAQLVTRAADEAGIPARWIHIEITESALMHSAESHVQTLEALRALGSQVSIDDFGTGYSNLSYLKHLPIDALKIDQAFVRDMNKSDTNDAAIVSAIVSMANSLGLKTIAEGIETAAQLAKLRELGCAQGQGYYFSRPVAAHHCRALLELTANDQRLTESVKVRVLHNSA